MPQSLAFPEPKSSALVANDDAFDRNEIKARSSLHATSERRPSYVLTMSLTVSVRPLQSACFVIFLPCDAMRSTVLVIVILSVRPSVCLSVCLSVRLSHSWTVSTWFDLRS